MEVEPTDPRDGEWEIDHPAYRVYFHTRGSSDTYVVRGAELDEVRRWAAEHVGGRWCGIYAVVPQANGNVGLVRVAGDPPVEDPLRGE